MRAVIICSGSIHDYEKIKSNIHEGDYIICADGGYDHAVKLGLHTDILMGDMDSVITPPHDIKTKIYPAQKDLTDGEIAVQYAIAQGFDEIILLGCIGTRIDHTLTNIFLLKQILDAEKKGVILDENNEIYMIHNNIELTGKQGDIVSVIPIAGDITGMTTHGLFYQTEKKTIPFAQSLGNSNCMTGDTCRITIETGLALVIKSRD